MVGTNEQVNRLSTGLAQGVAQEAITFVFRRGYMSMISRRSRGVHCTIFWWIVGRFDDASLWQRFIANVGHPSCKRAIKDLESLFTSRDVVFVRRGVLGNLGYVAERSRNSWRRSFDRRRRYTYACLVSFKNYLRTKGRTSFAIPCASGRSRNLATWRMKLELRGSEKRNRRENGESNLLVRCTRRKKAAWTVK